MTASELKFKHETNHPDSKFFTKNNMKFMGDTMSNYGVRSAIVDTCTRSGIECWELYRKRPVKCNVQASSYFSKETFEFIHKKIGEQQWQNHYLKLKMVD